MRLAQLLKRAKAPVEGPFKGGWWIPECGWPEKVSGARLRSKDLSAKNTGKRVYSLADQVSRFNRAKTERDERYLNIASVYKPEKLRGKRVLVVGASRGLGLALVQQLSKDGAETIATCRAPSVELSGAGAMQVIQDVEVSSMDSLKTMAGAIEGDVDYVIFNAGIFPNVVDNLDSVQSEAAMHQFDICGFGPVRCVAALKAAGKLKGSKVAVISSQAGSAAWRFTQNKGKGGDYGHHMGRAACNIGCVLMSEELRKDEVPLVVLHPGFNRTTMTEKYSQIWDREGAVPPAEGAMRVLHEVANIRMDTSGQYINCEDGLRIPF